MGMNKRVQVPVAEDDAELFRAAARKAGMPLAQWARQLLRREAESVLGESRRSPREAIDELCSLEAPVADVETMIAESYAERYG
ncbi:MAG: hypothetical protein ACQEXJ_06100 [Myxococcota bacterium]